MSRAKKVIVIGLDGLEPSIAEPMMKAGELPNLAKLAETGRYSRIATTYPAQTAVAWSTFSTGANPGAHGIFDFVARNPRTYLPEVAFTRYEQKNAFVPPKVVNRRGGRTIWDELGAAGIPSTVLRCPCTYPSERILGRMLHGMGVPDLRGGLGTPSFYSSGGDTRPGESENVVHVQIEGDRAQTRIIGPHDARRGGDHGAEITIELDRAGRRIVVRPPGGPDGVEVRLGEWSDWVRVKFKLGLLQSVRGMVRFHLIRLEPELELYASPVNFVPEAPPFPIGTPPEYPAELEKAIGTFYTTGMVEEHGGLDNGRFDEAAFLSQCELSWRDREAMMEHELGRHDEGLFYCLFDTPDRIQHMFWRFREPEHPANRRFGTDFDGAHVIEDTYRRCDEIVANAARYVDDETLFIVLSDHGFNSYQRGVNLNTWLHDEGLLVFESGVSPGDDTREFFHHVDWEKTKAYAVGLGGIYLNVKGREERGIVDRGDAPTLAAEIASRLAGLRDAERDAVAVRRALERDRVYHGEYEDHAPDVIACCAPGYRISSATAVGGTPAARLTDNEKKWSGDHIIDPELVPGVLLMNRKFRDPARLVDMAPTILAAMGLEKTEAMEGESLLP